MMLMAAIPLSEGMASPVGDPLGTVRTSSRTMVAYFTRSGNTRVIAGMVHRELQADLFEILPAVRYPEDYFKTVEQARQERDRSVLPPLASLVPNFASYDTVFLGFPIWGETIPPVICSFLSLHDMSGKILIPFITHGGFGVGNSTLELTKRATGALVQHVFVMEGDQERRTATQVQNWLGAINRSGA
jgi:flavodoxin